MLEYFFLVLFGYKLHATFIDDNLIVGDAYILFSDLSRQDSKNKPSK